jgi:hypothetical protein
MFSIAESSYGGWQSCFDIVSVHPYQGPGKPVHDPAMFWQDLDSARSIINRHAGPRCPLWVTEMGWPLARWDEAADRYVPLAGCTPEDAARNLCKFLASSLGSRLRPEGGFDRVFLYELTDRRDLATWERHGGFGLLADTPGLELTPTGIAARQVDSLLRGWRVCGYRETPDGIDRVHVLSLAAEADGAIGWLVWHSGITPTATARVRLPAFTDKLLRAPLSTGSTPRPESTVNSGMDGWFSADATPLPVFYFALGNPSRPDLVVDSLRVTTPAPRAGAQLDATVFLRNVGNRPTPSRSPVIVALMVDGEEVGRATLRAPVAAVATAAVSVRLRADAAGSRLLSAVANPDTDFVELANDNNAAYLPVTILPRTR